MLAEIYHWLRKDFARWTSKRPRCYLTNCSEYLRPKKKLGFAVLTPAYAAESRYAKFSDEILCAQCRRCGDLVYSLPFVHGFEERIAGGTASDSGSTRVLPRRQHVNKGEKLLLAQFKDTPQLGDRLTMFVHP
jgi:hypothetical protein